MSSAIKWKIGLAIVALVWGGLRLVREGVPQREVTTSEFGELAGEWLGKQIVTQFPDGGTVGVVQRPGKSEVETRMRESEIRGLERGLKGKSFTLVYPATGGASSPAGSMEEREGPDGAKGLSQAWAGVETPPVAVVSFVGVPRRAGRAAGVNAPPWYVWVDAFEFDWVPGMRRGEIGACVMMKYGGDWGSPPALQAFSPDRVLGARYACVTPETVDALLGHYQAFVDENGVRR